MESIHEYGLRVHNALRDAEESRNSRDIVSKCLDRAFRIMMGGIKEFPLGIIVAYETEWSKRIDALKERLPIEKQRKYDTQFETLKSSALELLESDQEKIWRKAIEGLSSDPYDPRG